MRIARQILDALEAAHEKTIIHRDLKPANLKFTSDNRIKVLDFGLAKALLLDPFASDVTDPPTIPVAATRDGTIVGTPAYMSPEQARGQPLTRSTDIWAFGCVLYEMLTGRPAFPGATFSDTLAGVLERPPDWNALPAATPPTVRRGLARCVEKDQRRRLHDAADVRTELDDVDATGPATVPAASLRAGRFVLIASVALAVVFAAAAFFVGRTVFSDASRAPEIRFESLFPREMSPDFAQLAVSPDGRQIAAAPSIGSGPTRLPLWLRPLESTTGRTLPGTEGALFPFWSPDSNSLGFFAEGKLKRIDLASESVSTVADAPVPRGGAWQDDGMILFAPKASGPLSRVPASGGRTTAGLSLASLAASDSGTIAYSSGTIHLTQLTWFDRAGKKLEALGPADLTIMANPSLSPDGSQVAFSRVTGGNWDIWRMDMHGVLSRFTSALAFDFSPTWSSDGRQIMFQSNSSTILMRPLPADSAPERTLWRLDTAFGVPCDVSPDGRVLLFGRSSDTSDAGWSMWYLSLVGDPSPRPFVSAPFDERDGQFSPDGKWVAYQSNESGRFEIYIKPFPGPGERIQVSSGGGEPVRWARTGELFYVTSDKLIAAASVAFTALGSARVGKSSSLFRTAVELGALVRPQFMVSPDAQRFLLNAPTAAVDPTSVQLILNWRGKN